MVIIANNLVKSKIRIALIYKNSYPAFQPDFFEKSSYDFFLKSLRRNKRLEISYLGIDGDYFDTSKIRGACDIILLANNYISATPENLVGITKSDIPVICRTADPHYARRLNQIKYHEKWKIDCYFNFMHEEYFYRFYPKKFKYKTILFGLEPSLYQNLIPFKERIKNKILNSGATGKTEIVSRIANRILNPRRSGWYFYKLRTIEQLGYVAKIRTLILDNNYYSNGVIQFLIQSPSKKSKYLINRTKEFITEASYRPGKRSDPHDSFERSHPGLVMPGEAGDVYWGRYYDFYRASCLAGMDPDEIELYNINKK